MPCEYKIYEKKILVKEEKMKYLVFVALYVVIYVVISLIFRRNR